MRSTLGRCLLLACLIQAGCASTQNLDLEEMPAERLPVGSSFYLNYDIPMRPGIFGVAFPSVSIQNGRVVRRFSIQQFEPYCEFILNTGAKGETVVSADNFILESVSQTRNFMQRNERPPLLAAAPGFLLAESESGSPGFSMTVIDYSLSSEFQGSGYVLRCRSVSDAASPQRFTIAELRQTLGSLFSVQTAVTSLDAQ